MADLSQLSDAELLALAQQHLSAPAKQPPPTIDPSEGRLPFRPLGVDTGLTMPQGVSRFMAGAGKAPSDLWQGLKQVGAEAMDYASPRSQTLSGQIAPGTRGDELRRQTDAERALSAPLMKTGAGFSGNLSGNLAMFAPTAFVPGANTYTGSALTGALLGSTAPVGEQDSRTLNTGLGAAAGIAGQAAGRILGSALRPVTSKLGPEEAALAAAAEREGIPLSAGQATGSKPLQIAESVLENLPLTSGFQVAGKQAQKNAFQAAVLKRAGIEGTVATPEILAAQKATVGGGLGDIAARGKLDFNQGLTDKLAEITNRATQHLPPAKAQQVAEQVDQILSQVDKTGTMAGTNYQGWREPLRALAKKGDEFASYYGDIRKALDTAFREQLPGSEGEAFRDLSRKYANLKTISGAMGGSSADAAVGNIPPAQLAAALSQSMGREGKALGRGDLNELSRIGRRFISPSIPDSGTAQRQFIQGLATTGGGSLVGGGAALATGRNPWEGAGYGAAAGGASLLAPKLAQVLMNSQIGQEYLKHGAVALTETQRAALANLLRTSAIGGARTLIAQ